MSKKLLMLRSFMVTKNMKKPASTILPCLPSTKISMGIVMMLFYILLPSWYIVSKESLLHNIKLLHHALFNWADNCIQVSSQKILNQYGKLIKLSGVPKEEATGQTQVHIWLDCTDFRMTGKCTLSKKDPLWSYK